MRRSVGFGRSVIVRDGVGAGRAAGRAPAARAYAETAHARDRQPVRDDRLGPAEATSSSTRCSRATRWRRSTPRSATTRPSSRARPPARATTWSSRSAATAPSTRPRTGSSAPTRRSSRLPGGSTNVWARTLGIPNDVVDATEHLLRIADDFRPRRVDLGRVNGRHFVFASGVGLDASVVERVDAHPLRKARFGAWYYSAAGVSIFTRRYLVQPAGRARARRRRAS